MFACTVPRVAGVAPKGFHSPSVLSDLFSAPRIKVFSSECRVGLLWVAFIVHPRSVLAPLSFFFFPLTVAYDAVFLRVVMLDVLAIMLRLCFFSIGGGFFLGSYSLGGSVSSGGCPPQ